MFASANGAQTAPWTTGRARIGSNRHKWRPDYTSAIFDARSVSLERSVSVASPISSKHLTDRGNKRTPKGRVL
jgi:hypothetical protein